MSRTLTPLKVNQFAIAIATYWEQHENIVTPEEAIDPALDDHPVREQLTAEDREALNEEALRLLNQKMGEHTLITEMSRRRRKLQHTPSPQNAAA